MTDIIKILTIEPGVFDLDELEKVSLGDSNNDRQPEMAAKTGNTYISETTRDTIWEGRFRGLGGRNPQFASMPPITKLL